MNRTDFQRLTEERLLDAQALLAADRFSGAYYLAGYSVECALKACICKLTVADEFPPKDAAQNYTHDLTALLKRADLERALKDRSKKDAIFSRNWGSAKDWREDARYLIYPRGEAESLIEAVSNSEHGVIAWLKERW